MVEKLNSNQSPNKFATSKSMPPQTHLLQPRFKSEINFAGEGSGAAGGLGSINLLATRGSVIGERSIGGFSPFFKNSETKLGQSPKR